MYLNTVVTNTISGICTKYFFCDFLYTICTEKNKQNETTISGNCLNITGFKLKFTYPLYICCPSVSAYSINPVLDDYDWLKIMHKFYELNLFTKISHNFHQHQRSPFLHYFIHLLHHLTHKLNIIVTIDSSRSSIPQEYLFNECLSAKHQLGKSKPLYPSTGLNFHNKNLLFSMIFLW